MPEPWSVYEGRLGIASAGRITLTAAFADLVTCRAGFDQHDLPKIFQAPLDDAENDACRDLVRLDAELLARVFISGNVTTFARPIEGGEVSTISPSLWEIDDPLQRFSTGLFNLAHWADPDTPATHRIFVAADQFDDWLIMLSVGGPLSAQELATIVDPIARAKARIASRIRPPASNPPAPAAPERQAHTLSPPEYAGAGPVLLTVKQVSSMVGMSRSTIYDWKAKGKFPPPLEIQNMVRWSKTDVLRWIDEMGSGRIGV